MAVLEKIRVKFGLVISIIIALALLSFIIDPGTLESALNSMSSKYDVGKIAGKNISYNDFQEDVDKYTVINEMLSGSSSQNEQTQRQIRNAAWQGLLDKYMFVKNAKAAGICVGEDEMVSLVSGETLSPVMAQNPVFLDEAGNFSSDMLKAFIDNVNSDQSGQLRTYWNCLYVCHFVSLQAGIDPAFGHSTAPNRFWHGVNEFLSSAGNGKAAVLHQQNVTRDILNVRNDMCGQQHDSIL